MLLSGNKVKRYVVLTCPKCLESFEVDWKEVLASRIGTKAMCPWCEHEFNPSSTLMSLDQPSTLVKRVDQILIVRVDKQAVAAMEARTEFRKDSH